MEFFKKALKLGIHQKVDALRFEDGQAPVRIQNLEDNPMWELPAMNQQAIEGLIKELVPDASHSPGTICQGSLEIVGFGELKLLARSGPEPLLYVFIPPNGPGIMAKIKESLEKPNGNHDLNQGNFSLASEPTIGPGLDGGINFPSPAFASPMAGKEEHSVSVTELIPPTSPSSSNESSESAESEPPSPQAYSGGDNSLAALGFSSQPELPFDSGLGAPSAEQGEASTEGLAATVLSKDTPEIGPIERGQEPQAYGDEVDNSDLASLGFNLSPQDGDNDPFSSANINAYQDAGQRHEEPSESISPVSFNPPPVIEDSHSSFQQDINTPDLASYHEETPTFQQNAIPSEKPIYFGSTLPDEMIDPNQRHPIDEILKLMLEHNASDVHLTQQQPVCFRVDGEIVRMNDQNLDSQTMESLLLPIMPPKNRREFAEIHDTDFAYAIPGLARFRVNIFRDLQGVAAVLRQIPDKVLSADDLGLPPAIRGLCELSKGLVLVTGPTGSGKSTTLAAMIDLINESRKEHILTIEDPVEFVHQQKQCLINQREVHKHTGSFSRALRAALREDPDIILIGEMRDLETVAIAIETAETGHLVFGTLHTNTAISTVDRLVDQFPADQQEQIRVMLAESLKGVVSQTLVKKVGGGRCAAHEILIVDRAISSIIREGNTHMLGNQMQTQKNKGNQLLNDALIQLVQEGKITPEDAWMKAVDKVAFEGAAQVKGIKLNKSA